MDLLGWRGGRGIKRAVSDRDETAAAEAEGAEAQGAEGSDASKPEDRSSRAAESGAERTERAASEGASSAKATAASGEEQEDPEATSKPNRRQRRAAKARGSAEEPAPKDKNARLRAARQAKGEAAPRRASSAAAGLDASELVDDAFTRSGARLAHWAKRNARLLQGAAVAAVLAGLGWLGWSYQQRKVAQASSAELFTGLEAELAVVGPAPAAGEETLGTTFETDEKRLLAASAGYSAAAAGQPKLGATGLAKLGLAGVLYDQGKYAEAKAAYEEVRASPLAAQDADVRARSLEGIGLSLEAQGDSEGAQKAFQELQNSDIPGMAALGLLHQARLAVVKGDKAKAKELLTQVEEKRDKSGLLVTTYVQQAARELASILDPAAVAPAGAGLGKYSEAELRALEEQIKQDPSKLQELLDKLGKSVSQIPKPTDPLPLPSGAPAGDAP